MFKIEHRKFKKKMHFSSGKKKGREIISNLNYYFFCLLHRLHPQNRDRQHLNFLIENHLHVFHFFSRHDLLLFIHGNNMTIESFFQLHIEEIRNFFIIVVLSLLREIRLPSSQDNTRRPQRRTREQESIRRRARSALNSSSSFGLQRAHRDASSIDVVTLMPFPKGPEREASRPLNNFGKKMCARAEEDVDEIRRLWDRR